MSESTIPPVSTSLRSTDLEMFYRLGITEDLLAEARIERVTDAAARNSYGIVAPASEKMSGIIFPYYAPETGQRCSARLRRDHPEMDGDGKPIKKYVSAYGDRRRLYYPPGAKEKLDDPSIPVVLVEAEKSSLALTAWVERTGSRLLVLAMGGCWGWRMTKQQRNDKGVLVDVKTVLFDLNRFANREVYILLDANVTENVKVQVAENSLIKTLQELNAQVRRCRLPQTDGVNGPDDYVAVAGDEAMAKVIESASTDAGSKPSSNGADTWRPESMREFLNSDEVVVDYYVPDIIAPGQITEMYAPRGLGKTILVISLVVKLAKEGKRVFYLNRDNPRAYVQNLLFGLGVDEEWDTLSYIGRDRCPSLTEPEKWARFPYDLYDVVVLDSFDSAAEGVGEQDSAKPAKAIAPLLDLCRKKNGPAVIVLCNTVKTGKHGRGSGVIEDRADIIYQVRDATGLKPTKPGNWIDELPSEGAEDWAARSSRRQLRTKFRLATICTKIRGVQPAPRCLEVNLEHEPYTVTDVTAEIDREGEEARMDAVRRKANHHGDGVRILREEIERRAEFGEPVIKKKEAENWLTEGDRFKRAEARQITADRVFVKTPVQGRGNPVLLTLIKIEPSAQIDPSQKGSVYAGSDDTYFGRPRPDCTAEIPPYKTRVNSGDFKAPISAKDPFDKGGPKPNSGNIKELEDEFNSIGSL